MAVLDDIHARRAEILKLAEEYGLTEVRVFGSVARGEERNDSDVDLLVTPGPHSSLLKQGGFLASMEGLLGRRVDVLTKERLHWVIRDDVLRESKPI